jgi:hypothetical protein
LKVNTSRTGFALAEKRLEVSYADGKPYGFVFPARYPNDEDLERIGPVVQSLIDKFATTGEVSG